MRIPAQLFLRREISDRKLLDTLENIRTSLDLGPKQWRERLGMTAKMYRDIHTLQRQVPASHLFVLADELHLSFDALITGDVDYSALAKQQGEDPCYIPERFRISACSRMRTFSNFANYIENHWGRPQRNQLLRHFQLTEGAVSQVDQFVSVNLMTEALTYLRKKGMDDQSFFQMGAHSSLTNRESPLAREIRALKRPSQGYELFANRIGFLEKNSDYQIKSLNTELCIVRSVSNHDIAATLGRRNIGSIEGCLQRAGIMSSVLCYMNLPHAKVKETSCEHRGDSHCQFEIDYSFANHQRKKRSDSGRSSRFLN